MDSFYYAIAKNEDLVSRGEKEKESLLSSIKRYKNEVESIKSLIKELRRRGHGTDNKLTGKNWEFTVSPIKDSIEITSAVDDWSDDEQQQCAIVKEVVTTTILKTVDGTVIESSERITRSKVPNLDVIRDLHSKSKELPKGITVKTNYAIRTHRILSN
mgnify:FL=1